VLQEWGFCGWACNPAKKNYSTHKQRRTALDIDGSNNNNNNNNNNKAGVDRLYVPRKQGGRGLMQLEAAHAVEITKLVEYVDHVLIMYSSLNKQ
jgi:hypothetical protein